MFKVQSVSYRHLGLPSMSGWGHCGCLWCQCDITKSLLGKTSSKLFRQPCFPHLFTKPLHWFPLPNHIFVSGCSRIILHILSPLKKTGLQSAAPCLTVGRQLGPYHFKLSASATCRGRSEASGDLRCGGLKMEQHREERKKKEWEEEEDGRTL